MRSAADGAGGDAQACRAMPAGLGSVAGTGGRLRPMILIGQGGQGRAAGPTLPPPRGGPKVPSGTAADRFGLGAERLRQGWG